MEVVRRTDFLHFFKISFLVIGEMKVVENVYKNNTIIVVICICIRFLEKLYRF